MDSLKDLASSLSAEKNPSRVRVLNMLRSSLVTIRKPSKLFLDAGLTLKGNSKLVHRVGFVTYLHLGQLSFNLFYFY